MEDYQGDWEGHLPHPESFNFDLTIEGLKSNSYNLIIANNEISLQKKLKSTSDAHIQMNIDNNTQLKFHFTDNKEELIGFVKSGH